MSTRAQLQLVPDPIWPTEPDPARPDACPDWADFVVIDEATGLVYGGIAGEDPTDYYLWEGVCCPLPTGSYPHD